MGKGRASTAGRNGAARSGGGATGTIKLENGVELRQPLYSDGAGEFQSFTILKDGENAGKINFGVVGKTGQIQDVELGSASRGQGLMKTVYPRIESLMKKQGATRVTLTTVDDAVGTKVWQPLGFKQVGGAGDSKKWEKTL